MNGWYCKSTIACDELHLWAYGNIASISNYGDTAVLGDESFTLNNYEYHTDTWMSMQKPALLF